MQTFFNIDTRKLYIPVEAPIAPMRIEGIAITKQPKAAKMERTWA